MKRADLIVHVRHYTVRDNNGVIEKELDGQVVGYTCQSVHVNFDGTVTFFCSGVPMTTPQEDVVKIDFEAHGAEFCAYCDQSIAQFSRV